MAIRGRRASMLWPAGDAARRVAVAMTPIDLGKKFRTGFGWWITPGEGLPPSG
jgi:hypothetical protein